MSTNVLFSGRISAIVEREVRLPDGKVRTFEYAERPPGVRILVRAGGQFLVTSEWRDERGGFDIRIPGGKVFDTFAAYAPHRSSPSLGEAAADAAIRELREETGILANASDLRFIKATECGATVLWQLYYYLVDIAPHALTPLIQTHEGELIEPRWITPGELFRHCMKGEVTEDRTAAVIFQWLVGEYSHLTHGGQATL